MEGTIYSLIPAILMLILVLLTKRVLLSLGIGIVVGALFIHDFNVVSSIEEIWTVFYQIFYSEGLNIGSLLLLGFLLLLGIMTAFLSASGGSRAFGEYMIKRVKTRTGAQLMTAFLGVIIFIDDYFNALAVGQIARPLTDRHKVSRAKLAYFIDSTSAPITVLSPISSWGAYIIGVLGSLFVANGVTDLQPLEAFIKMIPLNFYAVGALVFVFFAAALKMDIGPMRKHELRAIKNGQLTDPDEKNIPGDLGEVFNPHKNGQVYHLIIPIIVLVFGTVIAMIVTGIQASTDVSALSIFANTNVNLSLFIGGALAVSLAIIFHLLQEKPRNNGFKIVGEGLKTMLPAIYILLLAWMIGSIIGTLGTGDYLAHLVERASIDAAMLPFLFFIIAGLMALATGTSWGTFGIMLPIAAEIMVITDVSLLLPSLAAVLAGAVFGDHCSPISDTTILSSTGAGSNHIAHVLTQLPYACIVASVGAISFLIVGFSGNVVLALIFTLVLLTIISFLINNINRTKEYSK
ncbi:Na+/H+ antiporter NhaC family protein [Virgibacillus sp. DJP39]|uniref:Na+/H+ antiporter NhaC family protein n=1 Tax=Virgibacillus sp. DJP39 TaxID=3409790 RepID=UPI003BB67FD9